MLIIYPTVKSLTRVKRFVGSFRSHPQRACWENRSGRRRNSVNLIVKAWNNDDDADQVITQVSVILTSTIHVGLERLC